MVTQKGFMSSFFIEFNINILIFENIFEFYFILKFKHQVIIFIINLTELINNISSPNKNHLYYNFQSLKKSTQKQICIIFYIFIYIKYLQFKKINQNNNLLQQPTPISRQLTTAQTLVRSKLNDQTQIKKEKHRLDPMPINLEDPLDISITEEQLRTAKERQILERQQLQEQEKRRKLKLQQEEQLKYEIIAKDKKSKQFTYDYDGKLIPVFTTKITKLPLPTSTLGSKFEEDIVTKPVQKKKQYNKGNIQFKRNEEEKDTFKFNSLSPLVIENMNLQSGVTITYEGRLKEGLKYNTIDMNNMSNPNLRMARLEYLGLTQIMNSNRNQMNSVNIKAEDKEIKQVSNFNYEKLKRFTQQSHIGQGQIKINSTKIYDQMASTLFEEESIAPSPIKKPQEGIQKLQKNPIDQFNLSLYQNTSWGKETQNVNATYAKLITNKTIDKDLKMTIGNKGKRPRERKFYSEGTTLPSIRSQRNLYQI